ncbi:hypothetical protein VPH35_089276 [Triticum aestivum]
MGSDLVVLGRSSIPRLPNQPSPRRWGSSAAGFHGESPQQQHASLLPPHRQSRRTSPSSSLSPLPRRASLPFRSNFILVSHVGLVGKRRCSADCSSQGWRW